MRFTPPTCKKFVINALHFIAKPVTCQPAFFILLYVLLNMLDIYSIAVLHSYIPLLKSVSGFFFCYILLLPTVILHSIWQKIYKCLLFAFAMFVFVIDLYCLLLYADTVYTLLPDVAAAVLSTNLAETQEFFTTYLEPVKCVVVVITLLFINLGFYYIRRISIQWNILSISVLFVILLFSVVFSLCRLDRILKTNIFLLFTKECPDLRQYRQNPDISFLSDSPEKIVLIIGESFSKSHSSLYGYDKQTNPLLHKIKEEKSLLLCENTKSYAIATIAAMKSLMSAYTNEMADSVEWYRCLTLLEVMQNAGFKTYWCSNQCKSGLWDNEIGRYSDLCDEQFFLSNPDELTSNREKSKDNYDGNLIQVLEHYLSSDNSKAFFVLHLMGSHFSYNCRYPGSFSIFSAKDYATTYPSLSIENRQFVAEYDNSILYNDYVVYEIINRFYEKDAIVIYLSDHASDIFESSDDYVGPAKGGIPISEKAGREIPFMVYTSELFREKHPELQRRIENSVNRPYRTDSIMYTIMDVAGVESVNGVSYKHKSLFK